MASEVEKLLEATKNSVDYLMLMIHYGRSDDRLSKKTKIKCFSVLLLNMTHQEMARSLKISFYEVKENDFSEWFL